MLDWMRDQGSETDRWRRRRARHRFASIGGVVTTRVAALADVHGDLRALTRVLGVIERARPDDLVSWAHRRPGRRRPAAVVELVRQRCTARARRQPRLPDHGPPRARHAVAAAPSAPSCSGSAPSSPTNSSPGSPGCQHERRHEIELWHGSAQDPVTDWITGDDNAAATYRWLELDFGAQRAQWHEETP
jgi:hypothetical protein